MSITAVVRPKTTAEREFCALGPVGEACCAPHLARRPSPPRWTGRWRPADGVSRLCSLYWPPGPLVVELPSARSGPPAGRLRPGRLP